VTKRERCTLISTCIDGQEVPLPEQQAFIDRVLRSHALLVAGPGTGKTWTLARAAEHIVNARAASPEEISVLTLTRSMARSLAERIPYGCASTLHSFALTALNRIGEAAGRRVADAWEQENLVEVDLQLGMLLEFKRRIDRRVVRRFLQRMAASFRVDQSTSPDLDTTDRQLLTVFENQRELFKYRLVDEIVWTLIRLLESGVRLPKAPRYVLVDEYQDLTSGELRLLHILAEQYETRVAACGDDRQSIFGFRDADPLALHRFPKVYGLSNEEIDYLSSTKRCPQLICNFAELLAKPLPDLPGIRRPRLRPWENREDPGEVRVALARSPIGEARWVVSECRHLVTEEHVKPCKIMVVVLGYRSQVFQFLSAAAREVESCPFEFYDPSGFDETARFVEVRLLNAGMRLLVDPEDQLAWRTLVWAKPGLGNTKLQQLLTAGESTFSRNVRSIAYRDSVVAKCVQAGDAVIRRFCGKTDVSGVGVVTEICTNLGIDYCIANLEGLFEKVGPEAPPGEWVQAVFELSQKTQIPPSDRPQGIPVRTVFGAKGLEAEIVFVMNATPQAFALGGRPADGLRRLYVAVTRAKQKLYISAPGNLRYTTLGHATNATYGGLCEQIRSVAEELGLQIECV